MQILRGLYQLGGDMNGLTWDGVDAAYNDANTYLLEAPDGYILFDCGCGDTFDQILARMRYWKLDPARIRACMLTHAHFDHAGAAQLIEQRGIPIYAHAETADAIAAGDMRCAGFLYHKTFQSCAADHRLSGGERLTIAGQSIDVLHLPGHTRGCTAYLFTHEGQRIIVSGDVIGTLLAGDFGWDGSIDFDKAAYLESLKRLALIDTDLMLPGHGMIYFHQPRRRVEQVLNQALVLWR